MQHVQSFTAECKEFFINRVDDAQDLYVQIKCIVYKCIWGAEESQKVHDSHINAMVLSVAGIEGYAHIETADSRKIVKSFAVTCDGELEMKTTTLNEKLAFFGSRFEVASNTTETITSVAKFEATGVEMQSEWLSYTPTEQIIQMRMHEASGVEGYAHVDMEDKAVKSFVVSEDGKLEMKTTHLKNGQAFLGPRFEIASTDTRVIDSAEELEATGAVMQDEWKMRSSPEEQFKEKLMALRDVGEKVIHIGDAKISLSNIESVTLDGATEFSILSQLLKLSSTTTHSYMTQKYSLSIDWIGRVSIAKEGVATFACGVAKRALLDQGYDEEYVNKECGLHEAPQAGQTTYKIGGRIYNIGGRSPSSATGTTAGNRLGAAATPVGGPAYSPGEGRTRHR